MTTSGYNEFKLILDRFRTERLSQHLQYCNFWTSKLSTNDQMLPHEEEEGKKKV